MISKNCSTCEFFVAGREGKGKCRRYPPTVVSKIYTDTDTNLNETCFISWTPEVLARAVCGEWKAGNDPALGWNREDYK